MAGITVFVIVCLLVLLATVIAVMTFAFAVLLVIGYYAARFLWRSLT